MILIPLLLSLCLFVCDGEIFGNHRLSPKLNRPEEEYSIYSLYASKEDASNEASKAAAKEREQLYEAYNLLHTLAQVRPLVFEYFASAAADRI